jgi:hypothetical protein
LREAVERHHGRIRERPEVLTHVCETRPSARAARARSSGRSPPEYLPLETPARHDVAMCVALVSVLEVEWQSMNRVFASCCGGGLRSPPGRGSHCDAGAPWWTWSGAGRRTGGRSLVTEIRVAGARRRGLGGLAAMLPVLVLRRYTDSSPGLRGRSCDPRLGQGSGRIRGPAREGGHCRGGGARAARALAQANGARSHAGYSVEAGQAFCGLRRVMHYAERLSDATTNAAAGGRGSAGRASSVPAQGSCRPRATAGARAEVVAM